MRIEKNSRHVEIRIFCKEDYQNPTQTGFLNRFNP